MLERGALEQKSFLQAGGIKGSGDASGSNEKSANADAHNQYKRELKPMVYPNKHMFTPIKTEMHSRYAGSDALESHYGKQLQASREKEVPLQIDYDRLRKTEPTSCECDVASKEME